MHQAQKYSLIPTYRDTSSRCIGVLQQFQKLMSNEATLEDVAQLIQNLQQEFGTQEELECVIQTLVSRSLEEQLARRQNRPRREPTACYGSSAKPLVADIHV